MFLIRQAQTEDFQGVFALAKILDSYNLPYHRRTIQELLSTSEASFEGRLPKEKARYLFVLEQRGKIVGCSLIHAKHGTRGKPHLWFSLERLSKYSRTLKVRRTHQILRLGYTEDGPTEVGGLVVLPGYRRHPLACGMQISFVRFLYMGIHPERFEGKILVEYRGVLGERNRSTFWESFGRVFTGLSYKRADRFSVVNKEFILGLMPHEPIYCALLPKSVQEAIGAIHPAAQRAAALLRSIGFRPLPQVEPFDGGPYYGAKKSEITIFRQTRRFLVGEAPSSMRGKRYLLGTEARGFFRAGVGTGSVRGDRVILYPEAMRFLQVKAGDPVYVCPLSG